LEGRSSIKGLISTLCRWLRAPRVLPGSAGVSLLEVVVSVAIIAISGSATAGAIAGSVLGSDQNGLRSNIAVLAEGQLDSVATQGYREDGLYQLLPDIPPGFGVEVQVRPLTPGVLQEVTVLVRRTSEPPTKLTTLTTLNANRLLEIGTRPQAAGLEGTRPLSLPAEFGPATGAYVVVTVFPTDLLGELLGRWLLVATPPTGLVTERRSISLSIFQGTPFGQVSSGTSLTPPAQVVGTLLSSGTATHLVLEAFVPKIASGDYTLYFYNADAKTVRTSQATVSCICPE
jgi:type II secretory pathway pseudopilin PulG